MPCVVPCTRVLGQGAPAASQSGHTELAKAFLCISAEEFEFLAMLVSFVIPGRRLRTSNLNSPNTASEILTRPTFPYEYFD